MSSWSIRKKLLASFGAVIALVAISGAATYYGVREMEGLQDERDRYHDVLLQSQRLYTEMSKSRQHEKDFFARGGLEADWEALRNRSTEFANRASQISDDLGGAESAGRLSEKLEQVTAGRASYEEAFDAAAGAFRTRGTMDTGLQGEFRKYAHEIERIAEELSDEKLHVLLLQARRAEKDFLLRGGEKYRDRLNSYTKSARAHLRTQTELGEVAETLADLLDKYTAAFEQAFQAAQTLNQRKTDLHDATVVVEESLRNLEELSNAEMADINDRNADIQRTLEFVMAFVFLATIILSIVVARAIATQISVGVSRLVKGTVDIGNGDLSSKVTVETNDEIGVLANALNDMAASLGKMTGDIRDAGAVMNGTVNELQSTVAEQAASVQQQAASVGETAASVDELARSAQQVSDVAETVMGTADESLSTTKRGAEAIQESIDGMGNVRDQVENIARTILELSEKTQQIGTIIATVDDFAEQSSLLALNASIEAARAGENGKAFSVVAAEVKSLAEQSQQATEKVRSILTDIQRTTHTAVMVTEEGSKRVEKGVELAAAAGQLIAVLDNAISQSADSAKQIAAAARQQSSSIGQMSVAMSGIDEFSQQNLEAIKQIELTAQNISGVAAQLEASASKYRV